MTSNLDMNSILNSYETLQGNINVNNHRIINLHTPTSNNDAVNKAF